MFPLRFRGEEVDSQCVCGFELDRAQDAKHLWLQENGNENLSHRLENVNVLINIAAR